MFSLKSGKLDEEEDGKTELENVQTRSVIGFNDLIELFVFNYEWKFVSFGASEQNDKAREKFSEFSF